MLFSCSVEYRATSSQPLFGQFHDGVLGSSSLLGAAHRTQRYTLWIGKLVPRIAPLAAGGFRGREKIADELPLPIVEFVSSYHGSSVAAGSFLVVLRQSLVILSRPESCCQGSGSFMLRGGGGSRKLVVALLGGHTPPKIRAQFLICKHTSLILLAGEVVEIHRRFIALCFDASYLV